MSDAEAIRSPRLHFSLRLPLLAVLVVALLMAVVRFIFEREPPTVPLSQAIVLFNGRAQQNEVGALEPPLTEDEVVSAIEGQLPNLAARPRIKAIYERIAKTKQMPIDARFEFYDSWEPKKNDPPQIVWWINLEVVTGKNSGYGLRIRENKLPEFGQQRP